MIWNIGINRYINKSKEYPCYNMQFAVCSVCVCVSRKADNLINKMNKPISNTDLNILMPLTSPSQGHTWIIRHQLCRCCWFSQNINLFMSRIKRIKPENLRCWISFSDPGMPLQFLVERRSLPRSAWPTENEPLEWWQPWPHSGTWCSALTVHAW